jgi:hypothetical protein
MDASAIWDGSMTTELKAAGAEAIPAAVQVMSWSSSPTRDQSSIPLYEPNESPPALNATPSDSTTKMCLDISVLAKSIMGRRE